MSTTAHWKTPTAAGYAVWLDLHPRQGATRGTCPTRTAHRAVSTSDRNHSQHRKGIEDDD